MLHRVVRTAPPGNPRGIDHQPGAPYTRNPANILTSLRLTLALPIAVLISIESSVTLLGSALLFIVASLTDLADGYIARRRGQVSAFGAFLDPVADKVLIDATMIALVIQDRFLLGLAGGFVLRDLAVTILRLRRKHRQLVLLPGRIAKLKTAILYMGTAGVLLGQTTDPRVSLLSYAFVVLAATLSIISALDYVRKAVWPLAARAPV